MSDSEGAETPAATTEPTVSEPTTFEKGIMGSKKFKLAVFYIAASLGLAAGLAYLKAGDWSIVTAIVSSGFVAAGTIGGQAWQERYTRVAFFESQRRGG